MKMIGEIQNDRQIYVVRGRVFAAFLSSLRTPLWHQLDATVRFQRTFPELSIH